MSRRIDFTIEGGFPVTQETLDFLQQAYKEYIAALANGGSSNGDSPLILWGLDMSGSTLNRGWFAYQGDFYYCIGGDMSAAPGGGNTYAITITETAGETLRYDDGGVHHNMFTSRGNLGIVPTGSLGSTVLAFSSFKKWGQVLGSNNISPWASIAVATGSGFGTVTGTIKYRRNYFTNSLELAGTLSAASPSDFNALPNTGGTVVGSVPSGFIPATSRPFLVHINGNTKPKDATGYQYLLQLSATVTSGGDIGINFIKPDGGVSSYGVTFSASVPLD